MKKLLLILTGCLFIISCGSDSTKPAKEVSIEPTEEIIQKNRGKDFSIVLDDMKIEEETNLMAYQHKYNVLTVIDDSLHIKETPWQTVSETYFKKHENDLGMEIVSNHNNKLSRVAQPVGFGWAIGNEKHGKWEDVKKDSTSTATNTSSNNRRWRTSPSSFFFLYWMTSRRNTYRSDYNGFQSHARRGASYYGNNASSGNYNYGTRSNHQRTTRTSFFTRRSSNSSGWNNFNNRTSRSSSRYSSGSSTRSRSGGSGK